MDPHRIRLADGTEDPQARSPLESLLLAYAAMVPFICAAVAGLVLRDTALVARLAAVWGGGLLCFFAGVNRGLSFRQPGGPVLTQLAAMLWLFLAGMLSLLSPWPAASLVLEIVGFASMILLDSEAARHGEAPRYFGRLRRVQMMIPILSLAVLLWLVVRA